MMVVVKAKVATGGSFSDRIGVVERHHPASRLTTLSHCSRASASKCFCQANFGAYCTGTTGAGHS